MVPSQDVHPDVEQLNRYLTGLLSGEESLFVGQHLDDCTDCCQQIEILGTSPSLAGVVSDSSASGIDLSRTECATPGDGAPLPEGRTQNASRRARPAQFIVGATRYQLIAHIADGGMGAIYRARDLHLERDVALKVMGPGRNRESRLRRFRAEARVLGQLQHPGIPPVFDQGCLPDGRPFIAMKLIEGQTLADLLEKRPSPSGDLMHFLGIFKQVCDTVAFAHAQGVIHRDLKPENIMVGAFGDVQVMDWGLAKQLSNIADVPPGRISTAVGRPDETAMLPVQDASKVQPADPGPARTIAGAVIGTPAYMPPEQTGAGPYQIDERADVFSLGAILCEVLTGQPPYTGEKSSETFEQARAAALEGAVQRLADSGAEQRLVDLALRCLRPDPDDRIQSAIEIATELEANFESIQVRLREIELAQARQQEQRRRRRLQTILVVVVSLSVTLFTAGWAVVAQQNVARKRNAVEEVSTALGEARQLRSHALDQPLDGESNWSAAREAIRRAEAVAGEVADAELLDHVQQLSSQIEQDAEAARRDREFIARLEAADAPVPIPDLPDFQINAPARTAGPRGGMRPPFPPPPHHRPGPFGGPPDCPPPPFLRGPGGGPRGINGEGPQKYQAHRSAVQSERYVGALSDYGIDPRQVSAEQAARQIMKRPAEVRKCIAAALDSWLSIVCDRLSPQPQYRDWVLVVLAGIDPDPERTSIRALVGVGDQEELRGVAKDESLLDQSPAFISLVAGQLTDAREKLDLLRDARARYPGSLLINQQLGEELTRDGRGREAIDAFMVALAIQPDAMTNVHVGNLLADHGRDEEAVAMFRNAIRIDPEFAGAYVRLARALTQLERAEEAIAVVDGALVHFTPEYADAWQFFVLRGEACHQLQDEAGALEAYRHALDLGTMSTADEAEVRDRVSTLETAQEERTTTHTFLRTTPTPA